MLPAYLSVDKESKASRWAGMPTAVYKIDLAALALLRDEDKVAFHAAVDGVLQWLESHDGDHDAWVATPSSFFFTEAKGSKPPCIGNSIIPIKYTIMDQETSVKCMLTCTDGAPFRLVTSTTGEWTCFGNELFYHDQEERSSENTVHNVLFSQSHDLSDAPLQGPVVFTCF